MQKTPLKSVNILYDVARMLYRGNRIMDAKAFIHLIEKLFPKVNAELKKEWRRLPEKRLDEVE